MSQLNYRSKVMNSGEQYGILKNPDFVHRFWWVLYFRIACSIFGMRIDSTWLIFEQRSYKLVYFTSLFAVDIKTYRQIFLYVISDNHYSYHSV